MAARRRTPAGTERPFRYDEAFDRNIGWITAQEQQILRASTVAIAGLGGVGGVHLTTLARLGVGGFRIADMDRFELANFNRQIGATTATVGAPKAEVLAAMAREINPELRLAIFDRGVEEDAVDAFLEGADLFVDGLDFFALDIRARVFARCRALGIPAITAAPLGFGAAYLVFMPDGLSFEDYFRLEGLPVERQYVNFALGLAPAGLHRAYLVDPSRLDLASRRGPSTAAACQLCAGVAAGEAVKILTKRGRVRAAPWYHHFDPFRGRWVSRRLRGGNRNPVQAVKLRLAYRLSERLARNAQPAEPAPQAASEIEQILDLARWAPSGDNNQPWRFEITGEDSLTIRLLDSSNDDVYDYNGGQPTLLAGGFLLETLRIAASTFGRLAWWEYRGRAGDDGAGGGEGNGAKGDHLIDVSLPKAPGIEADPLAPFIAIRSVDRRRYRAAPLTEAQKRALEESLGDELAIDWHESLPARWRMARINALATDIRLNIPEAFRVHKRILDWSHRFSARGVPAAAIGLDPLTLRLTRWAFASWARMRRLNRLPGGTLIARIEMDLLPGLFCAAHFTVARRDAAAPGEADAVPALLRAGQALQRFWLTATRLGLAMQPGLAPLCFAHYGAAGTPFTEDLRIRRRAARLAGRIAELAADGEDGRAAPLLFAGRIGRARAGRTIARSRRRPLAELMEGEPSRKEARPRSAAVGD